MRLSLTVMHDVRRAALLPPLVDALAAEVATLPFALPWGVVTDTAAAGCWPTALRAWQAADPAADYHLVLTDDVLLSGHCLAHMVAALTALQTVFAPADWPPVSFYCARRKIMQSILAGGGRWLRAPGFVWGQATCLPTALLPTLLPWAIRAFAPAFYQVDDYRLAIGLARLGLTTWIPVPSLVDHAGFDQSLLGNGASVCGHLRVAGAFAGVDAPPPTPTTWLAGLTDPPQVSRSLAAMEKAVRGLILYDPVTARPGLDLADLQKGTRA